MQQRIGFCSTPDGARIAYATVGAGPALVVAAAVPRCNGSAGPGRKA
jgi:hypothetical protein